MFKEVEAQFTEWIDLHGIQIHIKDPFLSDGVFFTWSLQTLLQGRK